MIPSVHWISPADLKARVEAFRGDHWSSACIPVEIDHIVDVCLGIDVAPVVGLLDDHQLDAWLSADRKTIYIDGDCYYRENPGYRRRRRFTLAEEAGHWVLHDYLYQAASFGSLLEFRRFHESLDPREVARFEWQAKYFAANLLVPDGELAAQVKAETERLTGRGHELDVEEEAQVELLCDRIGRHFDVSRAVVKRRGFDLKLWGFEY